MSLPGNDESHQQREILDALPVLVFLERAGSLVFANAEARQAMGLGDRPWLPRPVEEVLWGLYSGTAEPQTLLTGGRQGSPFHATFAGAGNEMIPVEGTYSVLDAKTGEAVIVAQTLGRERAPKPNLMEDVLASLPDPMAIVHGSRVLYANPAFLRLFCFAEDDVTGADLAELIVPESRRQEDAELKEGLEELGEAHLETVRLAKDGRQLRVLLQVAPLIVNGDRAGFVQTFRELSVHEPKASAPAPPEPSAARPALAGEEVFWQRLNQALKLRLQHPGLNCGVLFVGLDGFAAITDRLGVAGAESVLCEVAGRMQAVLGPQDVLTRLGEEEFAVLVASIPSEDDLEFVARGALQELEKPFDVLGHPGWLRPSVGAVIATEKHETPESLVRDADFAMNRARQQGAHRYEASGGNAPPVEARKQPARAADRGAERAEFEICYEPVYRLATGNVEGFEALVLWRRPDGSAISLGDLPPAFKAKERFLELSWRAVESVCVQLRNWSSALPGSRFNVSLPLLDEQLEQDEIVEHLSGILRCTGADPSRLMLEVQERALNDRSERAVALLQRLVDCGVQVAIANFGSGWAPLNYLIQLPIERVKIEPALTAASVTRGPQQALLQSVIHLGKSVSVQLLAQRIETHQQLGALRRLGCELGQGNLLSRPLDAASAQRLAASVQRGTVLSA